MVPVVVHELENGRLRMLNKNFYDNVYMRLLYSYFPIQDTIVEHGWVHSKVFFMQSSDKYKEYLMQSII